MAPLAVLFAACRKDPAPTDDFVPDTFCPGDPNGACDDNGGRLEAGVAVGSIVPDCFESWVDLDANAEYDPDTESFLDCGCDRSCDTDAGYPGPDEGEGDGEFQAMWIAGFQNSRPASGVRGAGLGLRGEGDGMWAHAMVLRDGDTAIAVVALDLVGWFYEDVLLVRQMVADSGADVDHVLVHSHHDHQAVDTMGLWGEDPFHSGYDPAFGEQIRQTVVDLILQAEASTEPVDVVLGNVRSSDYHASGAGNVVGDTRDPYIVDDNVNVADFVREDGTSVVTVVGWASHPETRADENTLISADYVHALRETVENGVTWDAYDRPGRGAPVVYLNGALGGMMTGLRIDIEDPDGNVWDSHTWEKADANGQLVGEMALDAIEAGELVPDPDLSFRTKQVKLRIDNIGFQVLFNLDIVERTLYDWDETQPITDENTPWLVTEVNVVEVGPMQWLTLPAEILPENVYGGYDGTGTHTPGATVIQADNPNPPDLSQAPDGPYWFDHMTGEHRWIVGLANDELGYVIPAYDFVVSDTIPYLEEAEGHHYEETNSLGPDTAPTLEATLVPLLAWEAP